MFENLNRKFIQLQFGAKQRTRIYRKLNRLLTNSVPLAQALDEMYRMSVEGGRKSTADATVLNEWRKSVANGKGLAQAMKGWVPETDRLIIEGGEDAGQLSIAIDKAVKVSGSSRKIKSTLIGGLAYPLVLVFVTIGFLIMFGTQVIPTFAEIVPRDQWTGVGAQMDFMSTFVQTWLAPTLIVIGILIAAILITMPRWKNGFRVRLDKYPPWSLYRLVIGSGFLLTIAGMLKSGIPLPRALEMMRREASPWYRERLTRTLFFINNGHNLGEALHKTGYQFPDQESVQDLRIYAGLNQFEDTLELLGNEWLEDSVQKVEAQTSIMRNVAIVILGCVFGWIAVGIFSLQQQITSGL